MPRDGSGIYTTPAGTTAVPDTTIESSKYNGNIADVAADLNAPRPIIAGGTGGNSAATARANLKAEAASVLVTNYETHPFEDGSFYSNPGATNAPSPGYLAGICYGIGLNAVALEVRDLSAAPDVKWTRTKVSNVWSAWKIDGSGSFVELAGDTMTGDLTINKPQPILWLNGAAGNARAVASQTAGVLRWSLNYGDSTPETGANAGSDFALIAFNDAGVGISNPLLIKRATGNVHLGSFEFGEATIAQAGIITTSSLVALRAPTPTGTVYIQNGGGGAGTINYGVFSTSGLTVTGGITANGNINANGNMGINAAAPFLYMNKSSGAGGQQNSILGQTATTSRWSLELGSSDAEGGTADGSSFILHGYTNAGGYIGQALNINRATLVPTFGGSIKGPGWHGRQGVGGASVGSPQNFYWTSTVLQAWVDNSNVGTVAFTSDYRTKKDVADLPSSWDAVKALRPVSYTQAQYTPNIEIAYRAEEARKAREQAAKEGVEPKPVEEPQPMFAADDVERWGFVAHELQETLIESAATGYKDAPDHVQSPNPWTVIAALTKALQEAMARIEALEAAAAVPVR